jgi:hypothetical protein
MKLTAGMALLIITAGSAWAQNPDLIENTRNTMKAIQQKKAIDSNAALAAAPGQVADSNPGAAASPAPAVPATGGRISIVPVPQPKAKAGKTKKAPGTEEKIEVEAKASPEDKQKKETPKEINLTGRRDPFVSPVVNRSMTGSGCSVGKKCLAISELALKGVVRAETGYIAIVTNALNKAYFLHESDPVWNGYVMKITGDSVVFQETIEDKLGKPFTREVVKKITAPAV